MRSVPWRFSSHPSFNLFRTQSLPEEFKNEPEHPLIIVPMAFSSASLFRLPLCHGSGVPITERRMAAREFPAYGGLMAAKKLSNIALGKSGTVQRIKLIPLGTGKMCHTVGGKGLSAFPPTVLKNPMHLRFQFAD